MNDKFDELAKGLAQSVTRRGALKKFGVGLAGGVLALLGFENIARAGSSMYHCRCAQPNYGYDPANGSFYDCVYYCAVTPKPKGCEARNV